jgi:hypothetical protein
MNLLQGFSICIDRIVYICTIFVTFNVLHDEEIYPFICIDHDSRMSCGGSFGFRFTDQDTAGGGGRQLDGDACDETEQRRGAERVVRPTVAHVPQIYV